jgi:hypothetical protein
MGILQQLRAEVSAWTRHSSYYNVPTVPNTCVLCPQEPEIASLIWTPQDLKQWFITWEHRLDFWPAFKGALAAHEWAIWPFFLLLVVIFFLLLPRACRYP